MMTIKDLREILKHYEDSKYDDWEVSLWDYNQQQELEWGGTYASSKPDKKLQFPVRVVIAGQDEIFERIQKILKEREAQ